MGLTPKLNAPSSDSAAELVPQVESAERAAAARVNRRAAIAAADWAWRHSEPLDNLTEILDILGINNDDLAPRRQTIVLP